MTCSCCGQERDGWQLAALQCHDEIKVCRECIGWLRNEAGVPDSTPILPVRDIEESTAFFESAGFDVRRYEGGGFAFVTFEDESVFDLDQATSSTRRATGPAATSSSLASTSGTPGSPLRAHR